MKGTIEHFCIGENTVTVYCPPNFHKVRLPVLYLNQSHASDWDSWLPSLERSMIKEQCQKAYLVTLEPTSWGKDFSPWPAKGLHEGDAPFEGCADARIHLLTDVVKPEIDSRFSTLPDPASTGIFGYSLGGLAAIYAPLISPCFGRIGALSASLWYEGFMDYLRTHDFLSPAKVYLSLGSKEEKTRHPLMCTIGDCYRETEQLLKSRLGESSVQFDLHPGGHGTEVDRRILTGLLWLLRP